MYRIKRWIKHRYQKITRGFSDDETWSLDVTIADFVIPRLKRYKQLANGYPPDLTEKKWKSYQNEMIWAFEHLQKDMYLASDWKKKGERMKNGLALFAKYLPSLWW
jgi:hypothetical protein